MDTESLTGPEAVTKAIESVLSIDPAPKTTVVHFKVSSQGITLTDLRHKYILYYIIIIQGGAIKTGPPYLIANILKIP